MASPVFTLKVCRGGSCAVSPLSIIAAACWSEMPSGSTTSRSAGITRSSA